MSGLGSPCPEEDEQASQVDQPSWLGLEALVPEPSRRWAAVYSWVAMPWACWSYADSEGSVIGMKPEADPGAAAGEACRAPTFFVKLSASEQTSVSRPHWRRRLVELLVAEKIPNRSVAVMDAGSESGGVLVLPMMGQAAPVRVDLNRDAPYSFLMNGGRIVFRESLFVFPAAEGKTCWWKAQETACEDSKEESEQPTCWPPAKAPRRRFGVVGSAVGYTEEEVAVILGEVFSNFESR